MENLKDKIREFYSGSEPIYYSINTHLSKIINWANFNNVPFFSPKSRAKSILENTLPLTLNINNELQNEDFLIEKSGRYFVSGTPGSGKTVLIKRLIVKMLLDDKRKFGVPILLRPFELKNGSIYEELKNIFDNPKLSFAEIIQVIDKNNFSVFIDGIDELSPNAYEVFVKELIYLYENVTTSRLISTSRIALNLPNCSNCFIQPMTEKQFSDFVQISLTPEQSKMFTTQVKSLNLNYNPLVLSIFLSIFQRHYNLPRNQISVYRKIVNLFIEEWDSMRLIERTNKFSSFSPDIKKETLSFIAFDLINTTQTFSYTRDEILISLLKFLPKLNIDRSDSNIVLNDLINYTGLIVQVSYEKYQFLHKSIHEYLAAEYLIKLPNIPIQEILEKMPTVLAFCVLISSDPRYYLTYILDIIKINNQTEKYLITLLVTLFNVGEYNQFLGFWNNSDDNKELSERDQAIENAMKTAYNIGIANSGARH